MLFNSAGGKEVTPELLVEAAFTGEELVEVTAVEGGFTEEGEYLFIDDGPEGFHQVEDEGVVVGLMQKPDIWIKSFDGDGFEDLGFEQGIGEVEG